MVRGFWLHLQFDVGDFAGGDFHCYLIRRAFGFWELNLVAAGPDSGKAKIAIAF
jgi:hypothetical protein